jgi:putative hydrolase of the HAD superfamily
MVQQTGMGDIDVVLFDFGGVLAEKGFEEGMGAIAIRHRLNERHFYDVALDLIHRTGYLTGAAGEEAFWQAIRDETGISDDNATLRNDILSRFILRPWMFDLVARLKAAGIGVAILSDQTNWLDELNERYGFFTYFDVVFNSYHLGKSKVDPSHFSDTVSRLRSTPQRLLFVDDTEAHCRTARSLGLNAIHFIERNPFLKEVGRFCPGARRPDSAIA